jgi:hypothetical protein
MGTPPIYFNSTGLSGYQLETAIRKATKQNDRVILIYKAKNRPMSPSEAHSIYQAWFNRCPLTSIRRAITTLTPTYLTHTGTLRPGPFGAKEGVWELAE